MTQIGKSVSEVKAREIFLKGVTEEKDPTVPALVNDLSDVGNELFYKGQPVGSGGGGATPRVRIDVPKTVISGLEINFQMPILQNGGVYTLEANRGEFGDIDFTNDSSFFEESNSFEEINLIINVSNIGSGTGYATLSFKNFNYFGFFGRITVINNGGEYVDFSENPLVVGTSTSDPIRITPASRVALKIIPTVRNGSSAIFNVLLL